MSGFSKVSPAKQKWLSSLSLDPKNERESVSSHLLSLTLVFILDSELNFQSHVKSGTSCCFYTINKINRVRGMIIVHAIIFSRWDEQSIHRISNKPSVICRSFRMQLQESWQKPGLLQPYNTSSKIFTLATLLSHTIEFKISLLVCNTFSWLAPKCFSDMLVPYEPTRFLTRSGASAEAIPNVRTKYGEVER